jgi:hypothetical protein
LLSAPSDTGHAFHGDSIPELNTTRLAVVGGLFAGTMIGIHIYQQNGWWKDNRSSFHFREDLVYGLGVDKIGHFYAASILTFGISKAVEWTNMAEEPALYIGAGCAFLFQTYVEIEDGFSTWGFDRVDYLLDVAGTGWPLLQHHLPALQNVSLKMAYYPSQLINSPGGTGFAGQKHLMMDDYEGQTFWLSFSVEEILPTEARPYWPDFLNVALGYGARDIASPPNEPYRVWYAGLDVDFRKIIPRDTGFLRALGDALNFFKIPGPAVRFSPSAVWYGLQYR